MASVESDIFEIIAEKAAVEREKVVSGAKLKLEIESLDVVEIIFAVEEKLIFTFHSMRTIKNWNLKQSVMSWRRLRHLSKRQRRCNLKQSFRQTLGIEQPNE